MGGLRCFTKWTEICGDIWVCACGTEDGLLGVNRSFLDKLEDL